MGSNYYDHVEGGHEKCRAGGDGRDDEDDDKRQWCLFRYMLIMMKIMNIL